MSSEDVNAPRMRSSPETVGRFIIASYTTCIRHSSFTMSRQRAKVLDVVDGDTIDVVPDNYLKAPRTVRLIGIDCPVAALTSFPTALF